MARVWQLTQRFSFDFRVLLIWSTRASTFVASWLSGVRRFVWLRRPSLAARTHAIMLVGYRVAWLHFGSRASSCAVEAKPKEFFFETDPTPTHYTGPQTKAGSVIKEGEKDLLLESLWSPFAKAGFEVSEEITGSKLLRR
jgi:hypothetical protein